MLWLKAIFIIERIIVGIYEQMMSLK